MPNSAAGVSVEAMRHDQMTRSVAAERTHQAVPARSGRAGDRLHAQALGRVRPFLDDGRICLTNNAAERALRGSRWDVSHGLFAGSECDADRAAMMYTLIGTAKLNDVDPQAWLADVLGPHRRHPAEPSGRTVAVELGRRDGVL